MTELTKEEAQDDSEEISDGARKVTIEYDDDPVRWFIIASVGWSIVGMLVGAVVALQLAYWQAKGYSLNAVGATMPRRERDLVAR